MNPTTKKYQKSSDPTFQNIIKPFSNLYTSHKKTIFSSKDSIFLPETHIETTFEAKPMSKTIQTSKKTSLEMGKNKFKASSFVEKSRNETKPVYVSKNEEKPMFKTSQQNRKNTLDIEKQKSQNFVPKFQNETFFRQPVSVSYIEEKSKIGQKSRKTIQEIEKEKLRASVIGLNRNKDFKTGNLSENKSKVEFFNEKNENLPKKVVSMSKSQDSGLKVSDRSEENVKRPSFVLGSVGRRSYCNSRVELADFFRCNGVKIVSVDMPPFMQIHAVDCARKTCDSLEKFTSKTLAFTLKKEFDGVYGPAWHCIVGSSFGSFVTYSVGGFMYFSMDHKIYILLFKTTVQRTD